MPSHRDFESKLVRRESATSQVKETTADWTVWNANGAEPFEIHYQRAVSFRVVRGNAEIAFSDGTRLDVTQDDFVPIHPEIRGVWTIIEPIENLYRYHDGNP